MTILSTNITTSTMVKTRLFFLLKKFISLFLTILFLMEKIIVYVLENCKFANIRHFRRLDLL